MTAAESLSYARRHLQKAEEFVLTGAEMSTVVDLLE